MASVLNNPVRVYELFRNMGSRYVFFRTKYELMRKVGLLKLKFPTKTNKKSFISLKAWKDQKTKYFIPSRTELSIPKHPDPTLKDRYNKILDGQIKFFGTMDFELGTSYDWLTNPESQYKYDIRKHWTEIDDYSKDSGDIKYVWEKSRFGYLLDIIRYDHHYSDDSSEFVFSEINNWIDNNPLNRGPNYRCSQEISLRLMNWMFALYFYQESQKLDNNLFQKIINSLYHQVLHVYANINFSRIAVKNNHAITETLLLYTVGLIFPFFPQSKKWRESGKKWFEQEIEYQVYEDGSFLQFSHNYHRVLLQLLTFAINISKANGDRFSEMVFNKSKKALNYLYHFTQPENGFVPNYGANDGALFFNLNDCSFNDFRPQLNALHFTLYNAPLYPEEKYSEDAFWWTVNTPQVRQAENANLNSNTGVHNYPVGGYYSFRDKDSFSFIRCGSHKDRPSQADNMHLDIWLKGENIFHDSGTFKYNASSTDIKYFFGTASHNTVILGDHDQMKKGDRFIWYNWSQSLKAESSMEDDEWIFSGAVSVFRHIAGDIVHRRIVRKKMDEPSWCIEDKVDHLTSFPISQLWHTRNKYLDRIKIKAFDESGNEIKLEIQDSFYSSSYGKKEASKTLIFRSQSKKIKTLISIK